MAGQRVNVGTLFVELLLDDSELGTGTSRATKRLTAFADGLRTVAARVDATITAALERAALAAGAVATAAAVAGGSFERQMSKVAAVAGATAPEFAALTEEARRIGKETKFSATEAAYGMEALAQAGMKPTEVITATADAMALAGANAVDLDMATGLVAATLTQFNLAANEAGRVSDVFTKASQSSLLTVEDLSVAMRYAGTAGAALGYSLEETTAAVAQFRNLGLTGEQAGTNFRAMMEGLANPTKKAADTLAGLGIKLEEVNPQFHSFDEIVRTLADHNLELSSSYAVFGSIAGGNIKSLTDAWRRAGEGTNEYQTMLDELQTSHGTAARSFAAMADNVAGRWDELTSAAEEFLLVLFDMGKGPLKRLLEGLAERVNFLSTTFAKGAETGTSKLDALVDGVLALVDAAVLLIPRLEEVGAAMLAALVVSKGVTWTIALVELAAQFGVNLPAAIGKAIAALRAMTLAQAAFTATGLGAVLAGLAMLATAIARVADNFSGAARAAREMEGAQRGLREFAAAGEVEQARVAASLAATKAEISARIAAGEAVSDLERAVLSYTDAQAYAEIQAGKAVAYTDRIRFASEMSAEEIEGFSEALRATASDAGKTADELEYLASQFTDTMDPVFFESISGGKHIDEVMQGGVEGLHDFGKAMEEAGVFTNLFSGPLSKARELTGLSIHSFEDLTAAIARLRAEQEAGAKRADNLATSLAMNRDAANQARRTADALTGSTEATTVGVEKLSTAQEKAAAKGSGFDAWLEAWASSAERGQEELNDLNLQLRDMPGSLARIGAAQRQTIPSMVVSLDGVTESAADGAAELEAINEEVRRGFTFWGKMDGLVGGLGERLKGIGPILQDLAKRGLTELGRGALALVDKIRGGIESLFGALLDIVRPIFDLKSAFSGAFSAENDTNKPDEMLARIRAAQAARETAQNVAGFVSGFAAALPSMLDALIEELPRVLDAILKAIPKVVDAVVEAVPKVVDAVVESVPKIIDAVVKAVPKIVDALVESSPRMMEVLTDAIPKLVDVILSQLPKIIVAMSDGIISIIGMIPELLTSILKNLPSIIVSSVEELPKLITAIINAIPEIIIAITEQAPYIMFAVIKTIPTLVWAVISTIPRLVAAVIAAIPRILAATWRGFVDLWPDFWKWAAELAKTIGEGIMDAVTFGLFKTSKDKEKEAKGEDSRGWFAKLFGGGKETRAASGIEYAPRTMATVLEPGEGVLNALANQARLRRELNEPGPIPTSAAAGGAGGLLSLALHMDGRLLDDVLVSGMGSGRAPGIKRAVRSAAGRKPGFSRGRFQAFGG